MSDKAAFQDNAGFPAAAIPEAMNKFQSRLLPAELITGLPEIDAQHEALFGRLAFLKDLCLRTRHLPLSEAEALLHDLREHYATETRLAEAAGMDFSEHARQHEVMLLAVTKTLKEVVEGRANVFGLIRYLDYWFERHIAEEDILLGPRSEPRRSAMRLQVADIECHDESIYA